MNNSVYCITGGSGFLGKHLIYSLAQTANIRIKYLSRDLNDIFPNFENVELFTGNLLEEDSLKGFLEPNSILINLAYLQNRGETENLKAIGHLLKLTQACKTRRMVHCSTAVVVGRTFQHQIDEETQCKPHNNYEKTKYKIETVLLGYNANKLPITILRPTAVFGKNGANLKKTIADIRGGSKIINYLRKSLYSDRTLGLVGVGNVVDSIVFLADTDKKIDKEIFIISDDEHNNNNYLYVSETIESFFKIKPSSLKVLPIPEFLYTLLFKVLGKSNVSPKRNYSCQKIKKLGFKKKFLFGDELDNYIQWHRDEL